MAIRQDALILAAPFITAVRDVAVAHNIVGTVGQLWIEPDAPNVIPGQVVVNLEIRGLDEVTLTTRKPPDALQTGTDRDASLADAREERVLLFEGAARDAVRLFPANVNVAAALSLAGVGFDRTRVQVYADPTVTRNTHEVLARGWFGELRFTIMNVPTENPKTGRITALSVLKAIRNLQSPVVLVG